MFWLPINASNASQTPVASLLTLDGTASFLKDTDTTFGIQFFSCLCKRYRSHMIAYFTRIQTSWLKVLGIAPYSGLKSHHIYRLSFGPGNVNLALHLESQESQCDPDFGGQLSNNNQYQNMCWGDFLLISSFNVVQLHNCPLQNQGLKLYHTIYNF